MEFLNKKQKLILLIIGSIMFLFIGYYIINKVEKPEYVEQELENFLINEDNKEEDNKEDNNRIIVHITGEVEKEGIIEIEENSRLADVIEQAGGTTEEADLSKVNLAYAVKDGQKIYIPNIEENFNEDYITEEAGDSVLPEERENVQ